MALRYFATSRAMVVLPVPGLPVKIMCMDRLAVLNPAAGAALLHLQVVCQTEHILLDRGKAHQRVQLGADLVHSAGVRRRQQAEQVCRGGPVQRKLQPLRRGGQGHGAGKGRIVLQAVFTQGAEDAVRTVSGLPRPFSLEHWAAT